MRTTLFVFGTLKEGFPNHPTNRGRKVKVVFRTVLPFPLYLMGLRHTPWMLDLPGQGFPVVGEMYKMDEPALEDLDRLERVQEPDGYIRKTIELVTLGDTASLVSVSAQAYLKRPQEFSTTEARLGPILEYTIEHAALYRKREAKRSVDVMPGGCPPGAGPGCASHPSVGRGGPPPAPRSLEP